MSSSGSICAAFRRAAAFFPASAVHIAPLPREGTTCFRPTAFSPISWDPPVLAVTFPGEPPVGSTFRVALPADEHDGPVVELDCATLEAKRVGDHTLLLAGVRGVRIHDGTPRVAWRGASHRLRLDYPFLSNSALLDDFVQAWLDGSLPAAEWTHGAHVAVTGYYAFHHDATAVFTRMKSGISHFNTAKGGINGLDSGYHETLTRFWSTTIADVIRPLRPESPLDAARLAVERFGEDRDLPRLFYSFDPVRDRSARQRWIAPDLDPPNEWCGCWCTATLSITPCAPVDASC